MPEISKEFIKKMLDLASNIHHDITGKYPICEIGSEMFRNLYYYPRNERCEEWVKDLQNHAKKCVGCQETMGAI